MLTDLITLDKPLVSIDLEATGIDPKSDRIVQIGICKLLPDGTYTEWEMLVNPGVPIPKEASDVHGITNEKVDSCQCGQKHDDGTGSAIDQEEIAADTCSVFKRWPTFREIALILEKGFSGCDLLGYNLGAFDVPMLREEFSRAGITWVPGRLIDGFKVFQRKSPRNLTAAVQEYLQEVLVGAHGALADAKAALRIVEAQLIRHEDLPRDVQALHDMFFVAPRNSSSLDPEGKILWKGAEACIGFGKKHNGKSLREVKALDPGYLHWILRGEFNDVVKQIMTDALEGKFPIKP